MLVTVSTTPKNAKVSGADDLKSLSVQVPADARDEDVSEALGPLGRLDGDYVWLDVDRLRAGAGKEGDAAWTEGYDGMLAYAKSKGWVDEGGTSVRAHVERT